MRCAGRIKEFDYSHIVIEIDGDSKIIEKLTKFGNELVVLDVSKYRDKRSKSANNYFWELVGQIAKVLVLDRDTVYKMMLEQAGVMVSLKVKEEALPDLNKTFRLVKVIKKYWLMDSEGEWSLYADVNCYYGSSLYDTKEMAHLIEITRQYAEEQELDLLEQDWRQYGEIDANGGY